MSDRNVFRLRSWTHYGPKPLKDQKAVGLVSVDYKALPGQHVVMLSIGALGEGEELTTEKLAAMLDAVGLKLKDGAEIANTRSSL